MSDVTPSKDIRSAIKFCVYANFMPVDTFKFILRGTTVKYTDDTMDSRKEKLEWKIRRDMIGYIIPRIH